MSGPVQFSMADLRKRIEEGPPSTDESVDTSEEVPSTRSRKSLTKPPSPRNIVQLAKSRLREVKKELRRMKALEKELGQLERLIDAAEGKPRAVVSSIKRSAS